MTKKERYHLDPIFRARELERKHVLQESAHERPNYRANESARVSAYRKERYRTDPTFRAKVRAQAKSWSMAWRREKAHGVSLLSLLANKTTYARYAANQIEIGVLTMIIRIAPVR